MSDYDMTFAKHLADGDVFDAIFGAEDDNRMMDSILKESEDVRDFNSIEDGNGKIGGGKGIGSDLGPNHDANKPTDDSSDDQLVKQSSVDTKLLHFCIDQETLQHGSVRRIRETIGLDADSIYDNIIKHL